MCVGWGIRQKKIQYSKNDYVVNITNWLSLLRAPTDQNAFVFFLNAILSINNKLNRYEVMEKFPWGLNKFCTYAIVEWLSVNLGNSNTIYSVRMPNITCLSNLPNDDIDSSCKYSFNGSVKNFTSNVNGFWKTNENTKLNLESNFIFFIFLLKDWNKNSMWY